MKPVDNFSNSRLTMPDWARKTVTQATSPCQGERGCSQTPADQVLLDFASTEVRKGMLEVMTDEVEGMDEALGQPGKVVFDGVTTNFVTSGDITEYTQSEGKENALRYGQLNSSTGQFVYLIMDHKDGLGTMYDGTVAEAGSFNGSSKSGFRSSGHSPE